MYHRTPTHLQRHHCLRRTPRQCHMPLHPLAHSQTCCRGLQFRQQRIQRKQYLCLLSCTPICLIRIAHPYCAVPLHTTTERALIAAVCIPCYTPPSQPPTTVLAPQHASSHLMTVRAHLLPPPAPHRQSPLTPGCRPKWVRLSYQPSLLALVSLQTKDTTRTNC